MGLTRVVGIIAGLLLFIPAFSVVYEVIMRGMFNSPTEWVVEISTTHSVGLLNMPLIITS